MVKIYSDGADIKSILELNNDPLVEGFTTNPTLMKKAGITNYEEFAKEVLATVKKKPVSFEVFSDDWEEMERQALKIASWGNNVYVKIPYTNTQGIKMEGLVRSLIAQDVKINLTAVFSYKQIENAIKWLGNNQSIISVFAGRISDAGYDPLPFIQYAIYNKYPKQEILWASTRELWNIQHAEIAGADIITVGHDMLNKIGTITKDLEEYSIETVQMFYSDAVSSGFEL